MIKAALTFLFLTSISCLAQANCSINSGIFNVGRYDPLSSYTNNSSTTISVNCDTPTTITLSASGGNSNNPANRFFTNADNEKLYYNIYLNFEGNNVLGDGVNTNKYTGISGDIPIHIKIGASQNIGTGIYSDNILLSIDF